MSYWIYTNTVHRYARLHRGDCSHCNFGLGTHGVTDSAVGWWQGSPTYETALSTARASERRVLDCRVCLRESV